MSGEIIKKGAEGISAFAFFAFPLDLAPTPMFTFDKGSFKVTLRKMSVWVH